MKSKKDILKILIRKAELDTLPRNFTAIVMEEIAAQHEAVINPEVKSLLKRSGVEKPLPGFTQCVMAQVEAVDFKAAYKPIINKKVWLIIFAVAVVFVVLCLNFSEPGSSSPNGLTSYFINIGGTLNTILTNVSSVPSLYLITFISLGALLVTDYLLRTRGPSLETKSRASFQ